MNVVTAASQTFGQRHAQAAPLETAPGGRSKRYSLQVEIMHAERATVIRAVSGQQSRLESDECRGCRGADSGLHSHAGVCVQSAGNIESENRRAMRVGTLDPLRVHALDRACQTDAE